MIPFTIIIPTYNRPSVVLKAIQSVIDTEYPVCRIIVVNDGSNFEYDYTSIEKITIPCQIITLYENRGVSFARNIAMEQATTDWVVFLDDDDLLHKGYLHNLNMYLKWNRKAKAVIGWSVHADNLENVNTMLPVCPNLIPFSIPLLQRSASEGLAILKTGPIFDPDLKVAEDTDLLCQLYSNGIQVHDIGVTATIRSKIAGLSASTLYHTDRAILRIIEKHYILWQSHPLVYKHFIEYWLRHAENNGMVDTNQYGELTYIYHELIYHIENEHEH
jgi:glycosyltransferase involved in cell wall biosynthesis